MSRKVAKVKRKHYDLNKCLVISSHEVEEAAAFCRYLIKYYNRETLRRESETRALF